MTDVELITSWIPRSISAPELGCVIIAATASEAINVYELDVQTNLNKAEQIPSILH